MIKSDISFACTLVNEMIFIVPSSSCLLDNDNCIDGIGTNSLVDDILELLVSNINSGGVGWYLVVH